jgi:hypothetical protein
MSRFDDQLPTFRYYPGPLAGKTIEPSPIKCAACRQTRGYIVTALAYGVDVPADAQFCPWCVADGSAHRLSTVMFNEVEAGAPEAMPEVAQRTPGFLTWQDGSERSYVLRQATTWVGVVIAVLAGAYNVLAEPLTTSAAMVTAVGTALLLIASVWASARYVRQRTLSRRSQCSSSKATVPNQPEHPMSKDQAKQLMLIAYNFVEAIKELPEDKLKRYLEEQSEVGPEREAHY